MSLMLILGILICFMNEVSLNSGHGRGVCDLQCYLILSRESCHPDSDFASCHRIEWHFLGDEFSNLSIIPFAMPLILILGILFCCMGVVS